MHARPGRIAKASRWTDCLRRCEPCQVGISNARVNPTIIFGDPTLNVPQPLRDGVAETLAVALNERNRENKRRKFGFSTSEDALTWVVFRYLHDSGQLLDALRRAGLPIPEGATRIEAMLLWGVPVPFDRTANARGWLLRARLEEIADRLGEGRTSRTEPDVVIDLGTCLIIIEVKHRSPTDVKVASYAGWDRYYPTGGAPPYGARLRASGCYELARNWRFGLELVVGSDRAFTLVTLGPDDLFRGEAGEVLDRFEEWLPADGRTTFSRLRWKDLLRSITDRPGWLLEYVRDRGYAVEEGADGDR